MNTYIDRRINKIVYLLNSVFGGFALGQKAEKLLSLVSLPTVDPFSGWATDVGDVRFATCAKEDEKEGRLHQGMQYCFVAAVAATMMQ